MKRLMWGKALAAIAKKNGATYGEFKQFPEMVENSLQLNTTKGEKKEAKVEGGGVEAVKYAANTYGLSASFRRGKLDDGTMVTFPSRRLTAWLTASMHSAFSRKTKKPEVSP